MLKHVPARFCQAKISRTKGFTILEVMVALVFFALIGMVLQSVTGATVNQYLSVRHKMFASWIAENKLAELRLSKTLPAAKENKESIEFANEEWELKTKIITTENPDINRAELDIYSIDQSTNKKRKQLTVTSFVGRY